MFISCQQVLVVVEGVKVADSERLPMSDAEQAVLKVLWDHGPQGVKDVLAKFIEAGHEWSRSTVITLLQRLEKKGYVNCDKSQFAFVFAAAVSREDEMRARMNDLASELCDGETLPLVLAFAQQHRFSAVELARFREMIDSVKPKAKKRGGK